MNLNEKKNKKQNLLQPVKFKIKQHISHLISGI